MSLPGNSTLISFKSNSQNFAEDFRQAPDCLGKAGVSYFPQLLTWCWEVFYTIAAVLWKSLHLRGMCVCKTDAMRKKLMPF